MIETRLVVIGANSAIAKSVLNIYAAKKASICLISRDEKKLQASSQDLKVRGAGELLCKSINLSEDLDFNKVCTEIEEEFPNFNRVLIAHGSLSDQLACETNLNLLKREFQLNAFSTVALAQGLSARLPKNLSASLAVISSVAGDRGRASNYIYGSAKACVSTFLSGLRQKLQNSQIRIIDIKPGFIDTPMTSEFKKGALWAKPDKIAQAIYTAMETKNSSVYVPGFWRLIMTVICSIPNFLFKKLNL